MIEIGFVNTRGHNSVFYAAKFHKMISLREGNACSDSVGFPQESPVSLPGRKSLTVSGKTLPGLPQKLNIETTVCALRVLGAINTTKVSKDSCARLVLRPPVFVAQIGNRNFRACSGPLDREIPKLIVQKIC